MERLSVLRDGSVAYKLKYGSKRRSHRVMAPIEFMARLSCIIAPARLPLTRYHGVLAPGSSWRRQIVAGARAASDASDACEAAQCSHVHAKPPATAPARVCLPASAQPSRSAELLQLVPEASSPTVEPPAGDAPKPRSRTSTSYVPWAELMRRTFGIYVLCCPVCSATMALLAVITRQDVIAKILAHVKVPREPVANDAAPALYYDVTGEPVPAWARGVDPDPPERGPPADYDAVDPPAPAT